MAVKFTIETWNDEWRFEIEDKDSGDIIKTGTRETYTACAYECLKIAKNAAQPLRAVDGGDAGELEGDGE